MQQVRYIATGMLQVCYGYATGMLQACYRYARYATQSSALSYDGPLVRHCTTPTLHRTTLTRSRVV